MAPVTARKACEARGARGARGAVALYRLASTLATPLIRRHLRRRLARGREHPQRLGERFGEPGLPRPQGPVIWLHAASVGEAVSLLPLIDAIRQRWPALTPLLTTGTLTSAEVMAARLPPGALHQFVPVDCAPFVTRFLDHWRPEAIVIVESEIWPNILSQAKQRAIPMALVNSRISAKSLAGWRRFGPIARHIFGLFDLVLAQSEEDRTRLAELGAKAPRFLGNLKQAAMPPPADAAALAAFGDAITGRPRWLAASTHPGEEEQVADTHRRLAQDHPGMLTILAPRHPHRGPAIAQDLHDTGLTVALRSRNQPPDPATDIYIADTIGEMGLWYRLAHVVFIGGSLHPGAGGHNPLEAAKLGSAVICGANVANCATIVAQMRECGALRQVTDGKDLSATVADLLHEAPARDAMIAAARTYAMDQNQIVEQYIAALAPLLPQSLTQDGAGRTATPPHPASA
ncbi:MAG: 3-deoxy-D-manno-octulosonic acid transferase [Alphaproteobacteria bacterium]